MNKSKKQALLLLFINIIIIVSKETYQNNNEVKINEICLNNKNIIKNIYNNYSGWIELYNSGKNTIDLSGYGLSNEEYIPFKWAFPTNTFINPKEYLLVFTSDKKSKNGELHTNFELNKNGDYIFFSNLNGKLLEIIEIPSLEENESFGVMDNDNNFEKMVPSPLKKNQKYLKPPLFSHESGFYENNFLLTLSSSDDLEIYYTIDGSDPLNSNTTKYFKHEIEIYDRTNEPNIYSEIGEGNNSPLSISTYGYSKPKYNLEKAFIIRAFCKNNESRSKVISHSFFITKKNLFQYNNISIISIITNPTNLFDPEKGIYVVGNKYIEEVKKITDRNKMWGLSDYCNFNHKGEKWEREIDFSMFEKNKTLINQKLGIRIKGASTRNAASKSFNLYARKKYGEKSIKKILFSDNYDMKNKIIDEYKSFSLRSVYETERIRDEIVNKLTFGREYQSITDTKKSILFLNGEYWGFYIMMEKYSEHFFTSHYNIPKDDIVLIKENEISNGLEEDLDEYYDIMKYFSQKDLTKKEVYQELNNYLDIDSFIEYFVLGIYIGTWDWPNHNYGIWKYKGIKIKDNKYSDGKYRFFSFDFDFTMGNTYENYGGVEGYEYDNFERLRKKGENKHFPNYLFQLLLYNEEFKNRFILFFCDYINEVMNIKKVNSLLKDYKDNYLDILTNGKLRWREYGNGTIAEALEIYKNDYIKNFENILLFFKERPKCAIEHMRKYLNLTGQLTKLNIIKEGKGKIKINSIIPEFKEGKWSGEYFDNIPIEITAITDKENIFKGWDEDIVSNNITIIITLNEIKTIRANFEDKNK